MKLLICGSRSLSDKSKEITDYLNTFAFRSNVTSVISGMARGADIVGAFWARENDINLKEFYAEWDNLKVERAYIVTRKDGRQYNRNAGIQRNMKMLKDGQPDYVLAFIDSRAEKSNGTRHMIKLATDAGVPVEIIEI